MICAHADLEKDLGQTLLWRRDVDRHVVGRLEEARMMAVAARPSIVVVDRDVPWADRLIQALRQEPATRALSIVVVARGDFDPGEVELLESGANAILRLPVDAEGDARLRRLVDVPVRKEARFSVSFRVEAFPAGAARAEPGLALNLSRHGLLMETSVSLRVGERLEMLFALGADPELLRVPGRVVREAAASQYGLEFNDVPPDSAARLRRFLDGLGQA